MAVNFDLIKGALYGVAVGDALGGPLEFMSRGAVRKAFPAGLRDMVGGGWLNLKPGETTDDTAMSLCVADGILSAERAGVPRATDDELAGCIGHGFMEWLGSNPPDVGTTCRNAILRAQSNLRTMTPALAWRQAADFLGADQEGNGALMRCIYPGLWYAEIEDAEYVSRLQARMTHSGAQSEAICAWYGRAVYLLTADPFGPRDSLDLTKGPFTLDPVPANWSPSGYVVDTMHAVMLAMQESSFEEILVNAVNFGGDADTVGAIAGGLAGAKYGFKAIPKRWVAALDPALHAKLDDLAEAAYNHRK